MNDQPDQQRQSAEALPSPLPLDYERPSEPEPGRWGCLTLSLIWTFVTVLAWAAAGVLYETFGGLILALMLPYTMLLMKIGLHDGPMEKIALAMSILLPWPAYGLTLTWAGWHGDRRRFTVTASILAAVHTTAIIAAAIVVV